MRTEHDDMLDMALTRDEREGRPLVPDDGAAAAVLRRLAWQVAADAGRDGRRWRTCLCCRQSFESTGPANLVCDDCRDANDPGDWD